MLTARKATVFKKAGLWLCLRQGAGTDVIAYYDWDHAMACALTFTRRRPC